MMTATALLLLLFLVAVVLFSAVLADGRPNRWGQHPRNNHVVAALVARRGGAMSTTTTKGLSQHPNHQVVDILSSNQMLEKVRQEIEEFQLLSAASSDLVKEENEVQYCPLLVPAKQEDVEEAIHDFSASIGQQQQHEDNNTINDSRGVVAWKFLRGLAESDTFLTEFWHRQPLLLRASELSLAASSSSSWVDGFFTLERDLKQGIRNNSYISGHKTADVLRNGTRTDTWLLEPLRSTTPTTKTTPDDPTATLASATTWNDVEGALKGGTIYFNTAGSLWPSLGALCRLVMYAFGLPTNCNVYVTPPGCSVSVPPHTDRQDVFVLQTEGYKRWRVFAPPKRQPNGKDPLERGKQGDVLTAEELGAPLIDTVIGPGDVLYVPVGFPHTTDTWNMFDKEQIAKATKCSVHLTFGLDTHVWMLTMAHLRWALLQRCDLDFRITFDDDKDYWKAIEPLPVGFLARMLNGKRAIAGEHCWQSAVASLQNGSGLPDEYLDLVVEELQELLVGLEPDRWSINDEVDDSGRTPLPSRQEMNDCINYMVGSHWLSLLNNQAEMSKVDRNPSNNEDSLIKAFHGTQNQNLIMEKLAIFSKSEAMAKMYAQRIMMAKSRSQGL